VGYLCTNFSLPRPLCSQGRPGVCDRHQTDVRQKHRLMHPPYGGRGIIAELNLIIPASYMFFAFSPGLFTPSSNSSSNNNNIVYLSAHLDGIQSVDDAE